VASATASTRRTSMKRDIDLIRKLLERTEQKGEDIQHDRLEFEGYSESEVNGHVRLAAEQGLIEAGSSHGAGQPEAQWNPLRLSNRGHDFLEGAQDSTRWKKAREALTTGGGVVSVELLKRAIQIVLGG
jgi:hypothetical protein